MSNIMAIKMSVMTMSGIQLDNALLVIDRLNFNQSNTVNQSLDTATNHVTEAQDTKRYMDFTLNVFRDEAAFASETRRALEQYHNAEGQVEAFFVDMTDAPDDVVPRDAAYAYLLGLPAFSDAVEVAAVD